MTLVKQQKNVYQEFKIKEINKMYQSPLLKKKNNILANNILENNMSLKTDFSNYNLAYNSEFKSKLNNLINMKIFGLNCFFVLFLILFTNNLELKAQADSTKKAKPQKAEPMDLPNAIIYGDAYLNVGSSVKQNPSGTPKLETRELDSLNSLEKQSSLLLPVVGLSKDIYSRYERKGFLNFDFGQYITPDLKAGYELKMGNYDLFLNGGFNYSNGHVDNADFTKLFLDLKSDYIAPSKFWLFGGSKTRSNLFFKIDDFNNYAGSNYAKLDTTFAIEHRTRKNLGLNIDVDGNHDGYDFQTGFGFNLADIKSDSTDVSEQGLRGYLKISNPMNEYRLGVNLDVAFNNVNSIGTNLIQANVFGGYQIENFEIIFDGGIQLAKGTFDEQKFAILLNASTNIKLNENFTLSANVGSGIENNNFTNMMYFNPYLNNNSQFQYTQNLLKLKSDLWYHPNKDFGSKLMFSFTKAKDLPIYLNDNSNIFQVQNFNFMIDYLEATIIKSSVDLYYNFNENNNLGIILELYFTNLDGLNTVIPYYAPINANINYKINWISDLYSVFKLQYVGERSLNLAGDKLDSYNMISIHNTYQIKENLALNLQLNNLLNSKIYIWNGFIERGLFMNLGINWQFN